MKTPAYIFDQSKFTARLKQFSDLRQKTRFKLLYSVKALPLPALLETMLPYVDGFSASSLFEAKIAREVLLKKGEGSVHIITPGFRADEMEELVEVCDFLSINSLNQWHRFSDQFTNSLNVGLRVNPRLSFLDDDRYDPCREYSKLGVSIEQVELLDGLSGLHFHTMFGSESIEPLIKTLEKIEHELGDVLLQLDWINIGGGYVFNDPEVFQQFENVIIKLCDRYDLTVYFEPGKGIINDSGELQTSVIDLFESEDKQIAVLDTSVCHHPEVFEYQMSPTIKQASNSTEYSYILVGCSCKSGDLFGEYSFDAPLEIGSQLNISDVGAYSFVKASRFNGINLPDVYIKDMDRQFIAIKKYSYEAYRQYLS